MLRIFPLAGLVFLLFSAAALAEETIPTPAAYPSSVVIDMARIFKQHQGFQAEMAKMQQTASHAEADFKAAHQQLQIAQAGLANLKPGSEEHRELQLTIARQAAQYKVEAEGRKHELMEQEAQLYLKTYLEVEKAVAQFASAHNIRIVLKSTQPELDQSNRESILKYMNREVVYQNSADITGPVLELLNASKTGAPATASRLREIE